MKGKIKNRANIKQFITHMLRNNMEKCQTAGQAKYINPIKKN